MMKKYYLDLVKLEKYKTLLWLYEIVSGFELRFLSI